jgi:hypothetical protein
MSADLERRVARLERSLKPGGKILDALGDAIGMHVSALKKEIARVDRGQMRFFGVHESGRSYRANSLVVRRGGLWIALQDTTELPGTSPQWQLAVKSGELPKEPVVA